MRVSSWLVLALVLALSALAVAATTDAQRPDKEMLQMMDLLREMEMIRQMDMMQDMGDIEDTGDQRKGSDAQKTPPPKRKEAAK
jgi:hypothetical protein